MSSSDASTPTHEPQAPVESLAVDLGLTLPPAVRDAVVRAARRHHFAKGDVVLSRAQRAGHHWLVVCGRVGLGSIREGRLELQSRDAGPGEWVDALSAWLGPQQAYLEDAVALQPSVVLSISHRSLQQLGQLHPALLAEWTALLARRARDLVAKEFSLSRLGMLARLSAWLLDHAAQQTTDGCWRVALEQPKRAIASQLGVTPETLSRVLRQLVDADLVRAGRQQIFIVDRDRLRALATRS